jgi:hypothetical protein
LTACRSFLAQLRPQVPETYGTGRIEAQAQFARLPLNCALIGKKLLNGAHFARVGQVCSRFAGNYFPSGNNFAAGAGFSGL